MSFNIKDINKDLSVVCNKIVADDMKCLVKLDIVYKGDIYCSKEISKAIDTSKLEEHIGKFMNQFEFTVSTDDISKISSEVENVLNNGESINVNEKLSFNVALDRLYQASIKNSANLMATMCVDKDYFYINSSSKTFLETALNDHECGWKALDFKKQLKAYGLLEISSGRSYDFTVYTLGNSSVSGNKGINFLKINITKMNIFFDTLNKLKEVA